MDYVPSRCQTCTFLLERAWFSGVVGEDHLARHELEKAAWESCRGSPANMQLDPLHHQHQTGEMEGHLGLQVFWLSSRWSDESS